MTTGWKDFNLKNFIKGFFQQSDAPKVGVKVFHASYGEGIISDTKGFGATGKVTVDFGYAKPILPLSELIFDVKADERNDENDRPIETPENKYPESVSIVHTDSIPTEEIPQPESAEKHDSDASISYIPIEPDIHLTSLNETSPKSTATITKHSISKIEPHIQSPANVRLDSEVSSEAAISLSQDSMQSLPLPEICKHPAETAESRVIEARKGIMALRLGQVLESQVLDLSVGTENLERELRRSVSMAIQEKTVFVLLDAAWGAGKTHALTMLQALARENRMAISCVVMDGVSASFTYPMDLMSEVMSLLRFSDDPISCDLSYQLSKARKQNIMDYLERRGAHFISDTLMSLPPVALDDNDVMDAICDFLSLKASATHTNRELQKKSFYTKLKTIKASKLADRASRFVALLKEWAIFSSAMGCNGLLLVLDELDVEYSHSTARSASATKLRLRRRELLQELSQIRDAPLLVAFAAAPGGFDENEQNDPVLDIMNCFSHRIKHIRIPALEKSDFRQLLSRLLNLYADAYHLDKSNFDENLTDGVFEELYYDYQRDSNAVTRRFVRSSIERMDISFMQAKDSEPLFSPDK